MRKIQNRLSFLQHKFHRRFKLQKNVVVSKCQWTNLFFSIGNSSAASRKKTFLFCGNQKETRREVKLVSNQAEQKNKIVNCQSKTKAVIKEKESVNYLFTLWTLRLACSLALSLFYSLTWFVLLCSISSLQKKRKKNFFWHFKCTPLCCSLSVVRTRRHDRPIETTRTPTFHVRLFFCSATSEYKTKEKYFFTFDSFVFSFSWLLCVFVFDLPFRPQISLRPPNAKREFTIFNSKLNHVQ